ncbi:MAG TPA: hypothetical protein VFZ47_09755 [Chitinophagaceae bacterium]
MIQREIAQLYSGGKFAEIEDHMSDTIEWYVYEDNKTYSGKESVIAFANSVSEYFRSVTTKFETFGILEEDNKIAIYGRGEFIRGAKTVNVVHSCDVYEFNAHGKIEKVYSYCNSNRP